MNTCIYAPFYLPVIGGTELSTHYLSQELEKYCNLEICTFNWVDISDNKREYGFKLSSSLLEKEIIDGIPVNRYPIQNFPIIKNFSWKMAKDIQKSDFDIVHFQGLQRLFSRILIQRRIKNKITILTTHALQESINIIEKSKAKYLIKSLFVDSLKRFDHIIALSKTDESSLKKLGIPEKKITRIPNGINFNKFRNRKQYVNQNNKLKLLCVARFDENKRYEDLIQTIHKLKNEIPNLEAYFVGGISNPRYFEEIKQLILKYNLEKDITIGISLDDPSLMDCYLSCDIFILPSSMETFPLVILEAMYAGLPIVSTSVGGIPDVIKDGVNGFLVQPRTPNELYEKSLKLLKNEELRRKIAIENKKSAKEYSWAKVASDTYKI